jgi:hypothetical protein
MAKNSDYYYPVIKKYYLSAIVCCAGCADAQVRKQSFFAIGNSAFHSSELYEGLKGSLGHLVQGFEDSDERVRFNAVAAVCNLAKNSGGLVPALLELGLMGRVLRLLQGGSEILRRSGLVCLANLVRHQAGLSRALDEDVGLEVARLKAHRDPQAARYIGRILDRLGHVSLT